VKEPGDFEFARQLLETDQPVRIDAPRVTAQLVARRGRQKKLARIKVGVVAIATLVCIVVGNAVVSRIVFDDVESRVAESSSLPADEFNDEWVNEKGIEFNATALYRATVWEYQELEQQQKLARLKSEVDQMRRRSDSQQLTILKETLSRTLFDEIGFESLHTNY
jgi:hypothetical protein